MSDCRRCNGSGAIECGECNGTGVWEEDPYKPCEFCGGVAERYCPDCGGSGMVDDLTQDEINAAHDAWVRG